jgi:hypothetical protein
METIEQKTFKQPKELKDRLKDLSLDNLAGECNRISKNPESKLGGAIANILLISVFRRNTRGNDPYVLKARNQEKKTYSCHGKVNVG